MVVLRYLQGSTKRYRFMIFDREGFNLVGASRRSSLNTINFKDESACIVNRQDLVNLGSMHFHFSNILSCL